MVGAVLVLSTEIEGISAHRSEGVYGSGLVVRRSFALNCDAVHAIGTHEHARYAMELTVPSHAPAGVAKFSWSLNDPNGPFVGRIIRISRR